MGALHYAFNQEVALECASHAATEHMACPKCGRVWCLYWTDMHPSDLAKGCTLCRSPLTLTPGGPLRMLHVTTKTGRRFTFTRTGGNCSALIWDGEAAHPVTGEPTYTVELIVIDSDPLAPESLADRVECYRELDNVPETLNVPFYTGTLRDFLSTH